MPDPIKKSSWNIQQAKVKAEKDAKLKLLLQDKEFLNNLKEQSKKNNKNKEVNIKPSDATKVVIKNRPELTSKVARNKTDKEIAEERKAKIEESVKYQDVPFTQDNWREVLAKETQATGDKLRRRLEPNFFDDYLNPAAMIGSMASNLGQAPLQAQQQDSYMPYVTSVGTPIAVGAMAGLGTQNTGQFVNNLANPLAGTGDLVNNLGNKYLPNAYKLNPKAFRENPNAYYRQVFGEEASKSPIITESMLKNNDPKGIKSLWIDAQPKQQIWNKDEQILDVLELPRTGIASNNALPYFNKGKRYYANNNFKGKPKEFLLETKFDAKDYEDFFPASMRDVNINPEQAGLANKVFGDVRALNPFSKEGHNLSNYNLYKKDWLQGYKQVEVPKPTSNFKSEINWGQWNKEIPENTQLMKEYNAIEQTSKANNTWMKNPDGSAFQGTPEQFVQQNSKNFKKAFPNAVRDKYGNIQYNYHGTPNELKDNMFKEHFSEGKLYGDGFYTTPKKDYALGYAQKRGNNSPHQKVYELYQNANKKQELTSVMEKSDERLKNFLKENPKGSKDFDKKFDVFMKQEDDLFEKHYDPNDFKLKQGFDYFKPNDLEQVVPYSNYPKSAVGNNGMFDMTNPNIYKSIVPIAGASYLATQGQEESKKLQQGGYINQNTNMSRYAQGGDLTQFNEGGLHSQNPLGGIPLGTSNDGKTNMVEQGETKNGNYIYSNRLSVSSDLAKQKGLKSLKQVSDLTRQSVQTLKNWHKHKPELFKIVLDGCKVQNAGML